MDEKRLRELAGLFEKVSTDRKELMDLANDIAQAKPNLRNRLVKSDKVNKAALSKWNREMDRVLSGLFKLIDQAAPK